jgi:UDP-N-acetylmuramoyl-tripeptide--D-alanyl-D-alanine ligase
MKITAKSIADFYRLLKIPGGLRIFLRNEYDGFNPKLKKLARTYRRMFLRHSRIVVVVGSLGKTTTKCAVSAALNCPDRNFSYSNYGASLSENLLRIRPWDRHGVLEVGISGPGPMAGYAQMIQPDIVVVTSIKSDHNRSFPTLLDTRAEKVKMISALPPTAIAVLNGDDPNVRWMATQTRAKVITFGFEPVNDFRAINIHITPDGHTHFEVELGKKIIHVQSRLPGRHMVYPLLAAVVVAHLEKSDMAGVLERLAQLPPASARMEIIQLPGGIQILNDTKKASLESMHAAFDTFAQMPATRKIVVLGKVEEPVGKVRDTYREIGERLGRFASLIVCVGDDDLTSARAAAVRAGMDFSTIHHNGSRITGAAEFLREKLQPGDLVLVKGASAQKLQRVVLQLMGKPVSCDAKFCNVKVASCSDCPLLDAPANVFKNSLISRYFKV